jgi:hypothetical protein
MEVVKVNILNGIEGGFFLRNFSSQMQNWKRIIEKARNKLSLVELGRIPKKIAAVFEFC